MIRTARLADVGQYPLPPLDTSRPPWPGEHVVVGGTHLYVRTTPATGADAAPAVYVHGLGGASTNFTDMAALLSPYLAGEAIDLPGFGRSGPSADGDYSLRAHARIVIAYLEKSGRGPVHLVGNSMGGAICLIVAEERPDLVRTLTLISPAVPDLRPRKGGDLMLPIMLLPGIGARALALLDRETPERRARALISLCFAHPELVPPNRLTEAADDVLARRELSWAHEALLASLRGIARMYLTRGPSSAWRRMARVRARTLVVWGDRDRLVDVANAARVARTLPDASLLVLPDVGHTAQLEDPEVTARAILALVAPGRRADEPTSPMGVGA